jgi:toxin ParE1/3/4
VKVDWSARALRDLDEIIDFIAQDSPSAAFRMESRIDEAAKSLDRMPNRGRLSNRLGARELVISGTPYVIVYVVREGRVLIASVLHGAQDRPDH